MHRLINKLFPRVAPLLAAITLSACTTLGPDYQEPEVAWLNNWRPGLHGLASGDATGGADELAFWWGLFGDAALNELVAVARAQNPSLRIAGIRILESRARLGIAGSNLYPQVQQADSAVSYVNTQRYGGALPDDNQSLASYQAGFSVAWELDFWGRFRRGIESADAAFSRTRSAPTRRRRRSCSCRIRRRHGFAVAYPRAWSDQSRHRRRRSANRRGCR